MAADNGIADSTRIGVAVSDQLHGPAAGVSLDLGQAAPGIEPARISIKPKQRTGHPPVPVPAAHGAVRGA